MSNEMPDNPDRRVVTSVRFTPATLDRIRAAADASGVTVTRLIERAVLAELDNTARS